MEALSKKQEDEDALYSQVKSDFKSSSDVLEGVRPQANSVIEIGKRTSTDVSQLGRDIEALLNKMKELKDKISKLAIDFRKTSHFNSLSQCCHSSI
ncbi:unnamed protein product [Rodentolepis nana]|uniref:t-SNARE coiled-coil homology domain-containing protein n=1 Tax=Rodentolepis nana TaxID=102285 RepID=A0A0R3TI66_RODNA|nr:unnamed protein product [Rodentolepis nana]